MPNFDDFKLAIEQLSGGKNTVLFDDREMPSVMVPIPKFKLSDVITGASQNAHPAFMVDSVEKDLIYVSKFQNIVINDRAYSLAGKDPRTYVTFDQALTYCRNKGNGWCVTPFAVWAALALWCRANGTMPRGNNNYGQDHGYPLEKGTPTSYDGTYGDGSKRPARTATGSGPATWNHNWMPDGIADLNGNVWEWLAGMRLMDGEIQIIPYSNIFNPEISNAAASTAWKAIKSDGSLVDPGTAGTLKYDWVSSKIQLTTSITTSEDAGRSCGYSAMTLASGLTAPEIVKALALYPDEPGEDYGGDNFWMNNTGERLPFRGGSYSGYGAGAGVFAGSVENPRSDSGRVGFRAAFVNL